MSADKKKIAELMKRDLYALFDVTSDASEKEIKSAYRKKALTCHPDKNPDNPQAAELFQQLTDALLILSDPLTRATYNKLLKAKENKAIRDRELDAKRRKYIDELEARERNARERKPSAAELEKQLQEEIARLREEGARILEEESRLMREQLARSMSRVQQEFEDVSDCRRIKIRWKTRDGGYTREDLERFLGRHGRISALVISSSKPGSAMVEFEEVKAAHSALKYVKGFPGSPLTLSLVDGSKRPTTPPPSAQETASSAARSVLDDLDFEQMVYAKMRAHAKEQRAREAAAQGAST